MRFLFMALIFGLSSLSLAGTDGHGGTGIYGNDKKLYLIDFYEAGIQKSPLFDNSIPVRPDYRARVAMALAKIFAAKSPEVSMVAQKLSEIANVSNIVSEALLIGMENYTWNPVDKPTINPHDDHTPIDHNPDDIVPLAIRRERSITFNPNFLKLANPANRAGTIFHEISYAYVAPEHGIQNSDRAKEFNAMIFGTTLSQRVSLLRSFASSLHLPFGQMRQVINVNPKGNEIATIFYNPSINWEDQEQRRICDKTFDDCFNGMLVFSYFPGKSSDPIKDFCSSYDKNDSSKYNVFMQFVVSNLDVKFEQYLAINGHQMDYLTASSTIQNAYNSYIQSLSFTGKDCSSTFTDALNDEPATDFFKKFKAY